MPFVNKIVKELNRSMKESVMSDKYLQVGEYYGVSKTVQGENGNTPYIIDTNGHELNITVDDSHPFFLYHRILNTRYEMNKSATGDGNDLITERNDLVCIVYCNSERVKINENDLAFLVALGLTKNLTPEEINDVGVGFINCYATSTNYNSKQIFNGEYGNSAEYSFAGNDIYFSINYSIDVIASRYCLANC